MWHIESAMMAAKEPHKGGAVKRVGLLTGLLLVLALGSGVMAQEPSSEVSLSPEATPLYAPADLEFLMPREWTAVGQTESHCVQEMARCLGESKAGRWPL